MAQDRLYTGRLDFSSSLDIYKQKISTQARRTSIICTIGPSTNNVEAMSELMIAGMNIVRMNFSHGSYEYHGSIIKNAKEAMKKNSHLPPLAIALDTKGPEIRTGILKDEKDVHLEQGQKLILTTDESRKQNGDKTTIFVDYKNINKVLKVGGLVYIDDGLISCKVLKIEGNSIETEVVNSGILGSRKGVNLPEASVDLPAISEKDKQDLLWGVEQGVDMIFASFIRKGSDIKDIRQVLGKKGEKIKIIAKIENHEGVQNFDQILEETDGIMVARGDLGIEIPPEKVFVAQKMMISKCNIKGKPVICATQMLESMTTNPRPTRAEVTDVANAVLDGADCVMLSGETAKGKYPILAVQMMHKICIEAEGAFFYDAVFHELRALTKKPIETTESIASSAVNAAFDQGAKVIIVLTTTGNSARLLSKYRPIAPIIVVTRDAQTARQSHLYRGCYPLYYEGQRVDNWQEDVDKRMKAGINRGKELGFLKKGDIVIAIQGWKSGAGYTNTLRTLKVEE